MSSNYPVKAMAFRTPAETAVRSREDVYEGSFPMTITDHACATQHDPEALDDAKIDEALLPNVIDMNKESLETNSCEKEREPELDDESQSIDLSVSPVKGRENANPIDAGIYDERENQSIATRGQLSCAAMNIQNNDKQPFGGYS